MLKYKKLCFFVLVLGFALVSGSAFAEEIATPALVPAPVASEEAAVVDAPATEPVVLEETLLHEEETTAISEEEEKSEEKAAVVEEAVEIVEQSKDAAEAHV